MGFEKEFKEKISLINENILKYLPEEGGYSDTVIKACNYSVINGGKRLRPLLMQSVYLLIKGPSENGEYFLTKEDGDILYPFMAAIEMIHSSSLVHDDLPCMDNDRLRRGKPSTWAKFGEDMGTLAGDALMLFAFETAFKSKACPQRVIDASKLLAHRSGIGGMISGQSVDVELTGKEVTKDQLEYIYIHKTGDLIMGSMLIGAVLAGAEKDTLQSIEAAGEALGMAFQIQDDILDVTANEAELGKPIGSDKEQNKTTWLTYNGMEKSKKAVEDYTAAAVENIEKTGNYEFLKELMIYLIDRKY